MLKPILVAVGYARTSGDTNPKASIPNQVADIKEYCSKKGILLKQVFIDEKKSGMSTDNRYEYQKLKEVVLAEKVDLVIVSFSDRLARESFEFILMMQRMKNNGVDFISISEGLQASKMTPLEVAVIGIKNEMENTARAKRARSGIVASIKRGNYVFGNIAYGYKLTEDLKVIIDEKEAKAVRWIFQSYEEGKTISEIVKYLNENFKKKGDWLASHLGNMLDTEMYVGNRQLPPALQEELPGFKIKVPPIISEDQFKRVQMMRESKVTRSAPVETLLSRGVFRCPNCGRAIRAYSSRQVYYCPNRDSKNNDCLKINIEVLDKRVISYLKNWLPNQDKDQPQQDNRDTLLKKKTQNECQFATGKISYERFISNAKEIINAYNALELNSTRLIHLNQGDAMKTLIKANDIHKIKEYLKQNNIQFTMNRENEIIQYEVKED